MVFGTWWNGLRKWWRCRGITHVHYLERRTGRKVEYWMIRLQQGRWIQNSWGVLPRMTGIIGTLNVSDRNACLAKLEHLIAQKKAEGYTEADAPGWWCRIAVIPPDTEDDPSGFYEDPDFHELGEKLTEQQSWTHSGMYVAWLDTHGMLEPPEDDADLPLLEQLRARMLTPGAFFGRVHGGWLAPHHLTDLGNEFSNSYYKNTGYKADYKAHLLPPRTNFYHAADTWDNFDLLKPVLDARLAAWREAQAI